MPRTKRLIEFYSISLILLSLQVFANEKSIKVKHLEVQYSLDSGRVLIIVLDPAKDTTYCIYARGIFLNGELQKNFKAIGDHKLQNEQVEVNFEIMGSRSIAVIWTARDKQNHNFELIIESKDETAYYEYYGSGERYRALNHRGFILPMRSDNRWRNKGVGTYKPIPFIMSTQGYGVWVDSYIPGTFDLNAADRTQFVMRYPEKRLRVVFFAGPKLTDILDEFTRLTGRSRVPPGWAFGLWKSRNVHENQDSVMVDIENLRRYDIPANVIVLDSPWEYGYNDFRINREQFPNPEAMFDRIEELGFYLCVWLTPFINSKNVHDMIGIDSISSNYNDAIEGDYLIKDKNGEVATMKWWKGEGGLIDFTNPKAKEWYHQQLAKTKGYGVRVLKCDDGEGDLVPDAIVYDATPAAVMKNRYSCLYNQASQEYIDKYLHEDGVLMIRSGYTGAQQYPFPWAADNSADFSYSDGLPSVILACQNAAMSGMALYGSDIAGYFGLQTKELFIRWTQFSTFTALMQVHMMSNLGPWNFDRETLEIFRKFAKLRIQLFPYLYEAVHEASRTGLPVIRPMALAYQDDFSARKRIYQYLFGPDILVAPMYQSGTYRSVYLPQGIWYDFWTNQQYQGKQTMEVHVPLDKIPLYVRAGAIIPMLPDDIQTLIARHEKMDISIDAIDDRRILQVWPGKNGQLETWEGLSALLEREDGNQKLTIFSKEKRPLEIQLLQRNIELKSENAAVKYDPDTDMTIVRFASFKGEKILSWKED